MSTEPWNERLSLLKGAYQQEKWSSSCLWKIFKLKKIKKKKKKKKKSRTVEVHQTHMEISSLPDWGVEPELHLKCSSLIWGDWFNDAYSVQGTNLQQLSRFLRKSLFTSSDRATTSGRAAIKSDFADLNFYMHFISSVPDTGYGVAVVYWVDLDTLKSEGWDRSLALSLTRLFLDKTLNSTSMPQPLVV